MATGNSQSQLLFVQEESSWGVIPNSSGTATVANGDAVRCITAAFNQQSALIDRPDKQISLTATKGQAGRGGGSWTARMSLAGSGAAGTAPDCDLLLKAAFGKAGAVSAGVSVTYAIEDASPSLSIYNFRDPAGLVQQCAFGCVVNQIRITMGQDVAEIEFSGDAKWVIDTAQFATAAAAYKGGLTTFSVRPSSPTTSGDFAVGFTGSVTIDSDVYTSIRSVTATLNFNRTLRRNVWNSRMPGAPAQRIRDWRLDIEMDDDDSADLSSLKNKGIVKTAVAGIFQVGETAGNIWTLNTSNLLNESPVYVDNDDLWGVRFSGSRAVGTSTGKDEGTLVCT